MNKNILCFLFGACLALLGVSANAQEESSVPHFVPAEGYTCKFNEGKTTADLDKAIKKWNAWMDANGDETYGAWTMVPHHFSELTFDVAWVGSWTDGVTMGKSKQAYSSKGGEVQAEFNKVVTCGAHSEYVEVQVRDGDTSADYKKFIATFANCSIKDGKTMDDVRAATKAWNAVLDEAGSQASSYWWFPGAGNDDAKYNFKWINVDPDWQSVGNDWEKIMNGGLWRKGRELFGDTLDCDNGRSYEVTERRAYMPK